MKKLNMFQRYALVLLGLLLLHVGFTLAFPLRAIDDGATITFSREFIRYTFTSGGESFTYVPVLTLIYGALLGGLLLKKQKPYTLIYGIALMLMTKVNFLMELSALEGTQHEVSVSGNLATSVSVGGTNVAQDITIYIIVVLLLIKISIISYDLFNKHFKINKKSNTASHPSKPAL